MDLQRLLGPYGKLPVLIRDDDTNFFTKPNMLESIYSKAWEYGFKVSLAIIPFQSGTNDICVPPDKRFTDSHYSVADNKALVYYIKEKIRSGAIEILQHGLSHHITNNGRGEFGDNSDRKEDIELGRDIIRQAFGVDPKFFVSPGEDISNKNLMALVESGLIPIYRIFQ
jgi:hypothetical protein